MVRQKHVFAGGVFSSLFCVVVVVVVATWALRSLCIHTNPHMLSVYKEKNSVARVLVFGYKNRRSCSLPLTARDVPPHHLCGCGTNAFYQVPCPDGTCTVSGICGGITIAEEEEPPPNTPPALALTGPEEVEVTQFQSYTACTKFSRLTDVCDRGAAATDVVDGNLDDRVLACSPDGIKYKFSKKGVSMCPINTEVTNCHPMLKVHMKAV
jgi:hypothetical protein